MGADIAFGADPRAGQDDDEWPDAGVGAEVLCLYVGQPAGECKGA